jgi:hypothetical protein
MRGLIVIVILAAVVATAGVIAATAGGAKSPNGTLAVTFAFDVSRGMPTEGEISYVTIAPAQPLPYRAPPLVKAELAGGLATRSVTLPVTPGRYRLSTHQRTCVGNCDVLDPPSYACSRRIQVGKREAVRATVRVFFGGKTDAERCRIVVSRRAR